MFSCSSNEKPNEVGNHSRAELVGTWNDQALFDHDFILNIDSEGNLSFNCGLRKKYNGYHYNYAGKLAETFDYPYTIELTFTISSHASITSCSGGSGNDNYLNNNLKNVEQKSKTAKFTFIDASTCIASVNMIYHGAGYIVWHLVDFSGNNNNSYKKLKKQ